LLVGIPRYRLPTNILDAEIDYIRRVGVEIKTNTKIESFGALKEQGYHAIFLAMGAHVGTKMQIPGEELPDVIDCATFLREVPAGVKVKVGKRVAVVGGGNAAIDASRTALRLGAKEVTIFYRRTREEMPAADEEINEALEEGVKIEFLSNPTKIAENNGSLKMTCNRMTLGDFDTSGRRRPVIKPCSEFEREFDTIISSIGQEPGIPGGLPMAQNKNGTVQVDPETLMTKFDGVFAGGDMVSGPASVIEAIAAGRLAAISIDKYLGGKGDITELLAPPEPPQKYQAEEGGEEKRRIPARANAHSRKKNFSLVEKGFSKEIAFEEADRCLRCDLEED
jgi:NADPH-dependent glutamate synthase beta subunit-like oxidoreductase